jgi:ABC-type transporter Mla MlaB component
LCSRLMPSALSNGTCPTNSGIRWIFRYKGQPANHPSQRRRGAQLCLRGEGLVLKPHMICAITCLRWCKDSLHQQQSPLDLAAVAYMDTSGIATLIEGLKIARIGGIAMHLQGLPGRICILLQSTGIGSLLDTGDLRTISQGPRCLNGESSRKCRQEDYRASKLLWRADGWT